jgi:hypothetical protein
MDTFHLRERHQSASPRRPVALASRRARWVRRVVVFACVYAGLAGDAAADSHTYLFTLNRGLGNGLCGLTIKHSSFFHNVSWSASGGCNRTLSRVYLKSTLWDASGLVSRANDSPTYFCDTWATGAQCGDVGYSVSGSATNKPTGVYTVKTVLTLRCSGVANIPGYPPVCLWEPPSFGGDDTGSVPMPAPVCEISTLEIQCIFTERQPVV